MPLPKLTVADQCDRCIAVAWVSIAFRSGRTLTFCKHHYEMHEPMIAATASIAEVNDQRPDLLRQESGR